MFQTSTPVVGDAFQNRKAEVAALTRAIQRLGAGEPKWVAILGPRKIGKTSLVMEAVRLSKSERLRAVLFDVQEQEPISVEVFRRLALRIVDSALGAELGESLERLAVDPRAYRNLLQKSAGFASLPAALRIEIQELVDSPATPERIGTWLDFPEQFAKALKLQFLIALDEFQELGSLESQRKSFNPFTLMRSRWQKHRLVNYFISGSARSMLLNLVSSQQSPFFQHFEVQELGLFQHQAAVDLLKQQSPSEYPISNEVAELAVKTMTGHPFYLQLLGDELTERTELPAVPAFKAALQSLLFSRTGRLSLFFENEFQRLVGRSTYLAATLDALANGPCTLTAVSKTIQASSGATANYLERLNDAVVRLENGRYQIADPVFGLWLRWRRPGGTVVPMSIIGDEAELAVAQALSAMGFDLVYQSRASRGAFDLLATRGAAQLGVQVKRSVLPIRFGKAAWSRLEAEGERFQWHWVISAVGTDGAITILDPLKARFGREVSLNTSAEIPNLLLWLDARKSRAKTKSSNN